MPKAQEEEDTDMQTNSLLATVGHKARKASYDRKPANGLQRVQVMSPVRASYFSLMVF